MRFQSAMIAKEEWNETKTSGLYSEEMGGFVYQAFKNI